MATCEESEEELDYEEALSECSFISDHNRPTGTVSAIYLEKDPNIKSLFPKELTQKLGPRKSRPAVNHGNQRAVNHSNLRAVNHSNLRAVNHSNLQAVPAVSNRPEPRPPSPHYGRKREYYPGAEKPAKRSRNAANLSRHTHPRPQHGLTGNLPRPERSPNWPPPPHIEPGRRSPGWRGPPEALKELQNMKVNHNVLVPATPPHPGFHGSMGPPGPPPVPGPIVGQQLPPPKFDNHWHHSDHSPYNRGSPPTKPAFLAEHNIHETPPWIHAHRAGPRVPSMPSSHSHSASSPSLSSIPSTQPRHHAPARQPDPGDLSIAFDTPQAQRDKTLFDDNEDAQMEEELMELFKKNCPTFFPEQKPSRSRHGSGDSVSSIDAILSTAGTSDASVTGRSDVSMKDQFFAFNNAHFDVSSTPKQSDQSKSPKLTSAEKRSVSDSCSDHVLDEVDQASLSGKSDDLSLTSSGCLRPSQHPKMAGSDCGSVLSQALSEDRASLGSLVVKVEKTKLAPADDANSECGSQQSSVHGSEKASICGSEQSSLGSLVERIHQTDLSSRVPINMPPQPPINMPPQHPINMPPQPPINMPPQPPINMPPQPPINMPPQPPHPPPAPLPMPAEVFPPEPVVDDAASDAGSSDSYISQQSSLSSLVSKVEQTNLAAPDTAASTTPIASQIFDIWRPTSSSQLSDTCSETSGPSSATASQSGDILSQIAALAASQDPQITSLLHKLAGVLPQPSTSTNLPDKANSEETQTPMCHSGIPEWSSLPSPNPSSTRHVVAMSAGSASPTHSDSSHSTMSAPASPMPPFPLPDLSKPPPSLPPSPFSHPPPIMFPIPDLSKPPPMSPLPVPMETDDSSEPDSRKVIFKAPQGVPPRAGTHNHRRKKVPLRIRNKVMIRACQENLETIRRKLAHDGVASQPDRLVTNTDAQRRVDMSFTQFDLREELVEGMASNNIQAMTMLQYQCMDGALSGRNLMMFAKKGTGKSVVHAVSVLNEFTPVEGEVHAVIVCTIRDHAYRVKSLYKELAKEMPEVIIADCIGGNGYMKDLRKAMSTLKPNIIVGTIGRIDTLNKKMRFLQDVRFLVCEEMGLITKYPYLQRDLQKIISQCNSDLQLIGTSAECHADDMECVNDYFPGGLVVVQYGYWSIPTTNVDHHYLQCGTHNRLKAILYILENVPYKKVVIYIRDAELAEKLAEYLKMRGYKAFAFLGQFTNTWSIACRRCSNYILILNLTPGLNGLSEDNCKRIQETFKFWDLVRLIPEVLRTSHQEGYSSGKARVDLMCQEHDVILSRKMVPRVDFDLIIHCDMPQLPIIFLNRIKNCDGISKVRSIILVYNAARAMYVKDIYDDYLGMSITTLPMEF